MKPLDYTLRYLPHATTTSTSSGICQKASQEADLGSKLCQKGPKKAIFDCVWCVGCLWRRPYTRNPFPKMEENCTSSLCTIGTPLVH